MAKGLSFREGVRDGSPVFFGYFATSLAFGLLCRTSGLRFVESVLISMTSYAGSGQFMMMNLYNAGSLLFEIAISVFFINSRYIFMSASLYPHLEDKRGVLSRLFIGFGNTDENFAIASFKGQELPICYMAGLILTTYSGWVSGTAIGFAAGSFLPDVMQKAAVITIYAMFASILGSETRKNLKVLLVLMVSAALNSICVLLFHLAAGFSFIIAMMGATVFASLIYTDEEVFGDEM